MVKTDEKRNVLRGKVLDYVEGQIAAHGLASLNIRDIAAAVGCSVGTVYNLYADLDALIIAANSQTLHALDRHLAKIDHDNRDKAPLTRLLALSHAYLDFVVANRNRWAAVFEHILPPDGQIPDWHLQEHYALFRYIEAPLAALKPISRQGCRLLARNLYSGVHGIIFLGLQGRMPILSQDVLRGQLRLILTAFVRGYCADTTL
ncbi:MAG: Transcriptional regulatory protein, TetR family [Candidatus Tokpelaia hoelldobleri]|uniref:Transcriptional regulatory protein, TetR family n=1 Tax=Candidatus Tokpelaia hoelldobleri TaxID=1902579 RepID=A0A1U9JW83_9HYPH|nr:MAG: Transcriptional regulatory protein, TetR family [Candidatus Tokpelaia hoelldoblerii]